MELLHHSTESAATMEETSAVVDEIYEKIASFHRKVLLAQYRWRSDLATEECEAVIALTEALEASTTLAHYGLSIGNPSDDGRGDRFFHGTDLYGGSLQIRDELSCSTGSSNLKGVALCEPNPNHVRHWVLGPEDDEDPETCSRQQQRLIPPTLAVSTGLRSLAAIIMLWAAMAVLSAIPTAAAMEHQLQTASPHEAASSGWFNTLVDLSVICSIPVAILGIFRDLSNGERVPWVLGGIMAGLGFGSMFVVGDPLMPDALQISVMIVWGVVTIGFIIQKAAKGQMGIWYVFRFWEALHQADLTSG